MAGGAAGLNLNGPGGLIELLNSVLDFLSGLFIATPKLLAGQPLSMFPFYSNKISFVDSRHFADTILSGLPNLNGILKGILPNVGCQCQGNPSSIPTPVATPITSTLPVTSGPGLGESTCSRCGALIDIHHNEINSVKIVLG